MPYFQNNKPVGQAARKTGPLKGGSFIGKGMRAKGNEF
jgi:hypothetical protein